MAARSFLCNPSNFVHLILVLPSLSMTDPIDEEVAVTLGSSVRLICSHKSRRSPINVTWRVEFDTGTRCTIGNSTWSRYVDTCLDGKSQGETVEGDPYLHIPNIQRDDEGIYSCTVVFEKKSFGYKIRVTVEGNEHTTKQNTPYGDFDHTEIEVNDIPWPPVEGCVLPAVLNCNCPQTQKMVAKY